MGTNNSGGGDDGVGYRKPPKHSQFKPGRSGNPKGRAKGSRGIKTDLHAELGSRMTIHIKDQAVTATKQQLMLKMLTARAAHGDLRAIKSLIDLVMQVFGPEDRGGQHKQLSARDQALLDQFLESGAGENSPNLIPSAGGAGETGTNNDPPAVPTDSDEGEEADNA